MVQGCSKKFYQPGNHKLQTGSWLKKFSSREAARGFLAPSRTFGGMLPQRILQIKGLRLAENAFLYPETIEDGEALVFQPYILAM